MKNKYASVRVRLETYRELQHEAIRRGITFTRLMDILLTLLKQAPVDSTEG